MNPVLHELIVLFLSRVTEAEEIMKAHFEIEEPRYFRQEGISRTGNFDTYSYAFHGIGCCFSFENLTVDYDYAVDGRIDGFDLWRLSRFGEQFDEFKGYIKSKKIDSDFELAKRNEDIVRFEQGNLYYVATT